MPVVRTLSRAAAALALLLAPLAASPAHAIQPWYMELSIDSVDGGYLVCAEGEVSWWWTGGDQQWSLTITGSRSDGSRITGAAGSSDRTFSACVPVPRYAADKGEFLAAFIFTGLSPVDYGNEYGTGAWGPGFGSFVMTT